MFDVVVVVVPAAARETMLMSAVIVIHPPPEKRRAKNMALCTENASLKSDVAGPSSLVQKDRPKYHKKKKLNYYIF